MCNRWTRRIIIRLSSYPVFRIMHKQRSKFLISNRCLSAGRLTWSRNEDVTGLHWCTSRYFVGFLDVKCELSTSSYIFWRLTCLIVAVWSPGLNSAVEALNTLPQDILVEMVGKLIHCTCSHYSRANQRSSFIQRLWHWIKLCLLYLHEIMVDIMMLQRNTSISVIWQLMATKAIPPDFWVGHLFCFNSWGGVFEI